MEDIFHWIRKGDAIKVRMWLDDTEHDMNQGYVHQLGFMISMNTKYNLNHKIKTIFLFNLMYFLEMTINSLHYIGLPKVVILKLLKC